MGALWAPTNGPWVGLGCCELLELFGNIGPVLYTICFNGAGTIPRVGLVISQRTAENLN